MLSYNMFLVIFWVFFEVYYHDNDRNRSRVENGSENEVEEVKKEEVEKSIICLKIIAEK